MRDGEGSDRDGVVEMGRTRGTGCILKVQLTGLADPLNVLWKKREPKVMRALPCLVVVLGLILR